MTVSLTAHARALAAVARELGYREIRAVLALDLEDPDTMATALITIRIAGHPAPIELLPFVADLTVGGSLEVLLSQIARHPAKAIKITGLATQPAHGTVTFTPSSLVYEAKPDIVGDVVEAFEVEVDFAE